MKVVLVVIDSFGIGEMPDAKQFGDEGSNTYVNILNNTNVDLVNFKNLGLNNIQGLNLEKLNTIGSYAKMQEKSKAKDTTAGHYEISGIVLDNPYPTFPNGFPKELIEQLESELGVQFLGNTVASGTAIINELGEIHIKTRKPILYTSADSVLQIATHTDVFSIEELYDMCEKARKICCGKYNIGRIIARPFATNDKGEFYRLDKRKDYALSPPADTMLDKLKNNGYDTICLGKVEDIFNFQGITESYHSRNNAEGIAEIIKHSLRRDINGIIFANLNDTDMLYGHRNDYDGHRNDYDGYANALKEIDNAIPTIINNLSDEDILIITADHGCDPTTPSTDHSREFVPLLVYSKSFDKSIDLGLLHGFDIISKSILDLFNIEQSEESIFKIIKGDN